MIFRNSLPCRYFSIVGKVYSKVPLVPQEIPNCTQKGTVPVTQETVDHLERISLVDLGNIKGLKRLTSAIEFANQIIGVGTKNVEPLISVLENRGKRIERMSKVLNKIITLCEKHYLLQPSVVTSGEFTIQKYKYGPSGELLRKNIFEEWFLSNVIKTEENMFQYNELGDIATSTEANPGRYNLTDVKMLPQGETVMVQAEFPWASETVETICLRGAKVFEGLDENSRAHFEVRSGRKVLLPHVLESAIMLDRAVLAFICDAYNEPLNATEGILSLHRRLAPYKVAFSATFPSEYS
ncbi:hypothetical protein J437_LFUL008448 [Ladona fulva]|uniref:Uncharacterized protein n=1 Tax=Ladona fulva TaxID=123851 RepID=A0A8K0K934_LADFU|nr:hypothetical protein J437_LFUL008448 [Ladona fulva]